MPDTTPLMVWLTDPDGACTFLSQSWYDFTGQTAATGLGMGWLDALHPDDRAAAEATWRSANSRRVPFRLDFRVRRVDGVFRWAIDSGTPRFSPDGEFLGYIGGVIDITERRRAEEALRRSEAIFAAAFNAGPIILTITRLADGRFVEVNESFVASTGYRREEALGRTPIELGLWLRPEARAAGLERLRRGESVRQAEMDFRTRDGRVITCLMSADQIEVDGEPCILTALTDITVRKRAAEDARVLAELTEIIRLTEDADELLWQAARVAGAYLGARRCFFITIDVRNDRAVAHRQYCDGVPPVPAEYRVSDYSATALSEIARGRTIVNADSQADPRTAASYERVYLPYGERAYLAVPLLRDGEWVGLLWLSTDEPRPWEGREVALLETVAERTWMAVEKLRLYTAEQRARSLAEAAVRARDQFLQVASHELKTPLTTLMGNAQLIERRANREGTLSDRDRRSLRAIVDQAVRLDKMITALLDVTRFDRAQVSIERAPLDLAALVRRVADDVRPALVRHTLDVSGDAPLQISGDATRLEQVFHNLIGNAIKYSPAGGAVAVRLDAQNGQASVSVIDEGIGIPASALPHLFERFFRVDSDATRHIEGSGLGLYVVKEIIALHGGDVSVASEVGKGSVFTVRLPLVRQAGQGEGQALP
jgi:PAS domain S-box-containing protein